MTGNSCRLKPLGRTYFFTIVDLFGTAGIVYRADEMFNSFLAQEAASTSCADGGEYERFDLMKNHKGMEPWIGIMLLESRDDLRVLKNHILMTY